MTKTDIKIFLFIFLSLFLNLKSAILNPERVSAQSAISLSVSPPLYELMVKPGKSIKQIFTITNLGSDTTITPKIVYLNPIDEYGNIKLTEDLSPDWISYNPNSFKLKGQEKLDFEVKFNPPNETDESDHFLTLVFETSEPVDILNQNSSLYTSKIGTNILLTISKDGKPKKSATILEFSSPKVVDSLFGQIKYTLSLKNNGNSFWKPIGNITTGDKILKLAPQNVLSNYSRKIKCLDNDNLTDCFLPHKLYLGKIVAKLEFTIDEEAVIYKKEAITYAFPFSIVGFFLLVLTITRSRFIFKLWLKIRH